MHKNNDLQNSESQNKDASASENGTAVSGFFRCLDIQADQASSYSDGLKKIWQGDLQGILVRDVFSAGELASMLDGLKSHRPDFLKTWFPDVFRSWFYGRNLNLTDPELSQYFAEATDFNRQLQEWNPAFKPRIQQLLSILAAGTTIAEPPGIESDQRYMFTTLRGHDPEGYIPAHCDNEFFLRPAYRHLSQLCQPHILSFVLAFDSGESGGATEIFDFRQSFRDAQLISDDRYGDKPDIQQMDSVQIRIPTGAMLIFDSGQYLHRLMPVKGHRQRWTACSFMARAKAGNQIYSWG